MIKKTPSSSWWWQTAGLLLLFFIGFEILSHHKPGQSSFLPPCLFNHLTGLYCTGCGITRAFYALAHGNIKQALEMNFLAVIALPMAGLVWIQRGFQIPQFLNKPIKIMKDARFIAVIILIFTISRNIPLFPFSWLAPG